MTVDRSVTIRLRVSSAEFNAAMAQAGASVRVLRAEVEGAGRAAGGMDPVDAKARQIKKDMAAAREEVTLLRAALLFGPALIPLAGGIAALGSAAVGLGAAGYLAFKGIKTEMKDGTQLGLQYAGSLGVMKSGLAGLEQTAARGALSGFEASVGRVNTKLPQLDVAIAHSSEQLGSITAHLTGAAAAGLSTFDPLITKAETLLDGLAARFERWSEGGGGAKFAQTLADDLDKAVPAVEALATTAAHLVAAFSPVGGTMLSEVTLFSNLLNDLPVPVVQAMATAFVALKGAATVSALVKEGALALQLFALGEREVAAAAPAAAAGEEAVGAAAARSAGVTRAAAGSLGLIVGRAAPYVAGLVAANLILDHVTSSTDQYTTSTNRAAQVSSLFLHNVASIVSFHWSGLLSYNERALNTSDLLKASQKQVDDYSKSVTASMAAETRILEAQGGSALASYRQLQAATAGGVDAYAQGRFDRLQQAHDVLFASLNRSGSLDQANTGYSKLNEQIQKTIDIEQRLTATQKGQNVTLDDGSKVSLANYQAALAQTNGNVGEAIQLIHGHQQALALAQSELATNQAEQSRVNEALGTAEGRYKLTGEQVSLYASLLGITVDQLASGQVNANHFADAIGGVAKDLLNADQNTQTFLGDLETWQKSAQTAADRGQLIGAVLRAANGDALGYAATMVTAAKANQQLVDDMDASVRAAVDWRTGVIDFHNAAAAPLISDLQSLQTAAMNAAAATFTHERSIGRAKTAADDAYAVYVNDTRNALIDEADKLGLTSDQAQRLADHYFGLKNAKDIKKQIELIGSDNVQTALKGILDDLDILAGKKPRPKVSIQDNASGVLSTLTANLTALNGRHSTVYVDTVTRTNPDPTQIYGLDNPPKHKPKAFGGWISEGTTGTADDVLIRASKGEFVVRESQARKHPRLLEAINTPGYEQGGFVGVTAPHSGGGGGRSGSGSASHTAKAHVSVEFDLSLLAQFVSAVTETSSQLRSAGGSLISGFRKSVGSTGEASAWLHQLETENRRLMQLAVERDRTAEQLDKAQQKLADLKRQMAEDRSQVAEAITGAFDITRAGRDSFGTPTVKAILDEVDRDVANATLFQQQLAKLKSLGLSAGQIDKLAKAGFDQSEPEVLALTQASKADIAHLNAGVAQLGKTGDATGAMISQSLFGAGVSAAQGLVNGLKSKEHELVLQMKRLAHLMVTQIKHDLGIHSPSRVAHELGVHTATGFALGLADTEQLVTGQAARLTSSLGAAARPVSGLGKAGLDYDRLAAAVAKAISRSPVPVDLQAQFGIRGNDLVALAAAGQAGLAA